MTIHSPDLSSVTRRRIASSTRSSLIPAADVRIRSFLEERGLTPPTLVYVNSMVFSLNLRSVLRTGVPHSEAPTSAVGSSRFGHKLHLPVRASLCPSRLLIYSADLIALQPLTFAMKKGSDPASQNRVRLFPFHLRSANEVHLCLTE